MILNMWDFAFPPGVTKRVRQVNFFIRPTLADALSQEIAPEVTHLKDRKQMSGLFLAEFLAAVSVLMSVLR